MIHKLKISGILYKYQKEMDMEAQKIAISKAVCRTKMAKRKYMKVSNKKIV